MPAYHCRNPLCAAILKSPGYCGDHQAIKQSDDQQQRLERRHSDRKRRERDPEIVRFYGSSTWKATSKLWRQQHPLCQSCGVNYSTSVHHVVKVRDDWAKRLDPSNLIALCEPCHLTREALGK